MTVPVPPLAVVVLSFGHVLLAAAADIVLLIVTKVTLARAGRSLLLALPRGVLDAYAFVATNINWLFAAGGVAILLVWMFDPHALLPLIGGGMVVALVGGLFVFLWGGVIGLAVAVPALLIGTTYARARKTMDDYRLRVGAEPPPRPSASFASGPNGYSPPPRPAAGFTGGPFGYSGPPRPSPPPRFAAEYRVLGLAGGESPEEIKRRWRSQVSALHPDLLGSDGVAARDVAQERLKYVNAAYTVLRKHGMAA